MIRALVFGATGYTGLELIRILASHPGAAIVGGSSRNWAGKKASEALPFVKAEQDFTLRSIEELKVAPEADVAFLALPHGESAGLIRPLLDAGLRVVDLSADVRLSNLETYEKWYGPHKAAELVGLAVYGLPEIHRELIRKALLVANPGCYPTTAILGTAPLLGLNEVDTTCPVVDSKSGISGAGRGAKLNTSFCEAGEGFKPYGVLRHRHIPEMEQELSKLAGKPVKVRFTPHLIPVSRGMVSTIYLPLRSDISEHHLREAYVDYYESEPFIKVLPKRTFPNTALVRGSNQCHISVDLDERTGWVVAIAALDNLVKGASGAAVQNMNLMMGIDETTGLTALPMFP
jgi:N-acetyl-gamma-glutamyl-phosphate reductase